MVNRLALVVIASSALAGCGWSQPSLVSSMASTTMRSIPLAGPVPPRVGPVAAVSTWMEPSSKGKTLLYISDVYGNVVWVLNYPKLTPAGVLTGFDQPESLCTDSRGDVWVTATLDSELVEYAHGSKSPKATLLEKNQYPSDCSVDPNSGDLAVANIVSGAGSSAGDVAVFKHAAGKPKIYRDGAFDRVFFLSYDDNGTIWVDGQSSTGSFVYASLKNGHFSNIVLSGGSIDFAGGVDFIHGTITVGDQQGPSGYSVVYQTTGNAITGSTPLQQSADVANYIVDGTKLLGPDALAENLGFWSYPAGGNELRGFVYKWNVPLGIALSK